MKLDTLVNARAQDLLFIFPLTELHGILGVSRMTAYTRRIRPETLKLEEAAKLRAAANKNPEKSIAILQEIAVARLRGEK